jgi:anaerobic ribonucleoside-triphosphate reductase activating protein
MKEETAPDIVLNIHGFLPFSYANGPGCRAVIWLQGCPLACPECFNPETHALNTGESVSATKLIEGIAEIASAIDGVTISGGEPLQQRPALFTFLQQLRKRLRLSAVGFTGYSWAEIKHFPEASRLYDLVDIVIAGRYDVKQKLTPGILSSANQTVHFLSARYAPQDIEQVPATEVIIASDGNLTVTGIDPIRGEETG